eukprot:NODE_2832_length_868_cov_316.231242.p2 GENE.NODE_2832_length_868_cov_316.231242~~NODE_2832_length_868_cov_316.231242.p2  ORF type:complete len:249 (+),score=49.72 NODE_2832_length_868_cov_316.231242:101-847(+)
MSSTSPLHAHVVRPLCCHIEARLPSWVTPNMITFVNVTGFSLGWFFGGFWYPLAIVAYLVLDALDGIVARSRGKCSRLGAFFDHYFDSIVPLAYILKFSQHFTPQASVTALVHAAFSGGVILYQSGIENSGRLCTYGNDYICSDEVNAAIALFELILAYLGEACCPQLDALAGDALWSTISLGCVAGFLLPVWPPSGLLIASAVYYSAMQLLIPHLHWLPAAVLITIAGAHSVLTVARHSGLSPCTLR